MQVRSHLLLLSRYQGWALARLYDFLRDVTEADYRRDCGLFFKSIHGTLNHLLLTDRLWYGRFAGSPVSVAGLDEELCAERAVLREEILLSASRWPAFIDAVDAQRFDGDLQFITTEGTPRGMPFAATLAHVFNHGTHHRGQVSAALTALGYPAPEIDLYYFILAQEQAAGPLRAFLESKFAEINDEIAHYPSPIARCDVQLTKLLESRSDVVAHLKQLADAKAHGEAARVRAEILRSAAYDGDPAAEALMRATT
ncbi:MAG: hypothetical protein BroJett031_22010 [Betaproteobacteria bacterium]|nr:MAG: hypothetical protein BroJett031_22010 [Betaproteobacteria bacterium]